MAPLLVSTSIPLLQPAAWLNCMDGLVDILCIIYNGGAATISGLGHISIEQIAYIRRCELSLRPKSYKRINLPDFSGDPGIIQ